MYEYKDYYITINREIFVLIFLYSVLQTKPQTKWEKYIVLKWIECICLFDLFRLFFGMGVVQSITHTNNNVCDNLLAIFWVQGRPDA